MTTETTYKTPHTITNHASGNGNHAGNAPKPPPLSRFSVRFGLVAAFAVIVAVVTYAVSSAAPAAYKASSEVRVSVNENNGLSQDSLQAANLATAQDVQLIPTDAVLAGPAAKLGTTPSALSGVISVGSVAQQNLVQISGSGSTPAQAQQRAAEVTAGFMQFTARDAKSQLSSYQKTLGGGIGTMTTGIDKLAKQLANARGSRATVLQTQIGSLSAEQQALRTQLATRQATGIPSVQLVEPAGLGNKVSPKPALYSVVALLVAAFVGAQLLALTERKRRAAL